MKTIMTLTASAALALASLLWVPASHAQYDDNGYYDYGDYYDDDLYGTYGWDDEYDWGYGEEGEAYNYYEYDEEWWTDDNGLFGGGEEEEDDGLF